MGAERSPNGSVASTLALGYHSETAEVHSRYRRPEKRPQRVARLALLGKILRDDFRVLIGGRYIAATGPQRHPAPSVEADAKPVVDPACDVFAEAAIRVGSQGRLPHR